MSNELVSQWWQLEVRESRGEWYETGGKHLSLDAALRFQRNHNASRDKRRKVEYRIYRYELQRFVERELSDD